MTNPHEPDMSHLSPAHQMRLRLALARLDELRSTDPARCSQATLVLLNGRIGSALEDMVRMVLERESSS